MTGRRATTMLFLPAALALAGCTNASEDREAQDHIPGSDPDAIERHIYVCSDRRSYLVDVFRDGLTIDLTPPDGKPLRLSAFSQDPTYVGNGITARISGPVLHLERANRPVLTCRQKLGGRG